MDRLERAWSEFRDENPAVYDELVRLARDYKARGMERVGIAHLFEIVRWQRFIVTKSDDGWKLNNSLRAPAARDIMRREPDLAGFFVTREPSERGTAETAPGEQLVMFG